MSERETVMYEYPNAAQCFRSVVHDADYRDAARFRAMTGDRRDVSVADVSDGWAWWPGKEPREADPMVGPNEFRDEEGLVCSRLATYRPDLPSAVVGMATSWVRPGAFVVDMLATGHLTTTVDDMPAVLSEVAHEIADAAHAAWAADEHGDARALWSWWRDVADEYARACRAASTERIGLSAREAVDAFALATGVDLSGDVTAEPIGTEWHGREYGGGRFVRLVRTGPDEFLFAVTL
jgi:hypothetical protein